MAKFIMTNYEELKVYQGKSGDALAGYAYNFHKEGKFLLFLDGLVINDPIVRKSTEEPVSIAAASRSSIRERQEKLRDERLKREGPYICEPMEDDVSEEEPDQPHFDGKTKRRRKRKHAGTKSKGGDFVLDGIMVDS